MSSVASSPLGLRNGPLGVWFMPQPLVPSVRRLFLLLRPEPGGGQGWLTVTSRVVAWAPRADGFQGERQWAKSSPSS